MEFQDLFSYDNSYRETPTRTFYYYNCTMLREFKTHDEIIIKKGTKFKKIEIDCYLTSINFDDIESFVRFESFDYESLLEDS